MKRKELRKYLESYLDRELAFRDYRILPLKYFRKVNRIGVHQVVDSGNFQWVADNAVGTFCRDGYPMIYFYLDAELESQNETL